MQLLAAPLRGVRPGLAGWVSLALVAVAVAIPLAGYPVGADVAPSLASRGPSAEHWLGTDHLGRDVAFRALLATRAFVFPGLFAVALALGLGIPLGAAAGWDRSPLRQPARVVTAALAAVPAVVLVLLLSSAWGPGARTWGTGAGVAFAPGIADLVRERLERLAVGSVVDAARAHGFSEARILWVHGVWLGAGRSLVRRALELFGSFAALECTLSYLGHLGVPEPTPSWGNMIAFEWGHPVGAATVAPALALWAVVTLSSRTGGRLSEPES